MIGRRSILAGGAAAAAASLAPGARAAAMPGVTKTSLKIGNTMPYSGPASSYGAIGHAETAFFNMVNEKGGIAGHKIDFISYDDGYLPPRRWSTCAAFWNRTRSISCSTPWARRPTRRSSATEPRAGAELFVATGASKWGHYTEFPWTIGLQPSYRTEAQIYAKYILQNKPAGKIGILYQNDDFGKDYVTGLRDVLGKAWRKHVVKSLVL